MPVMVSVVQLVRASDCGSECRRFESDRSPLKRQLFNKVVAFFYAI